MSRYPNISQRKPKPSSQVKPGQQPYAVELLKQGLTLHQKGYLAEAKTIYEKLLEINPRNFDALHLSGVIAAQTKNPALAVDLIGKAIEINPNNAAAYSNRGNALQKLKRLEESVASCDRAIEIKSDYAEAYNNRGIALQELKRFEEAIASYARAIEINSDYAEAYNNRAISLQKLKRFEEAVASYDRAIEINSDYAEAYSNRGNALHELKRLEEAVASCDRAIALKPDYAEAYSNRGVSLKELKRLEDAVASYDHAIAIEPDYAEAYSNRGNALKELRRLEEAVASCDRAIALKPDYADAYISRGIALQESKRLEEAIASYDRSIAINPDDAAASWNKSLAFLLSGEFELGWKLYESRWLNEKTELKQKNTSQPLWLGAENITGKTILLHAEQGLGDTIQFCRYASLVKARGARVVMEVPQALVGLLDKLVGVDELVAKGKPLPAFDYHCPMLSLPLAFKTRLESIPSSIPYLATKADKYEDWKKRLGERNQPRVGLVWSGSTGHKNDHNRSLSLQEVLPHLPQGNEYVSLQKEIREIDKVLLAGSEIRYFGDEIKDFTDTAALCELMDVVVSVDTSVAHLAAAIGKKTWILLPYVPDWRWLLDRDDSPWYGCVSLYRQDKSRNWDTVLKRVVNDMRKI